MTSEAIAHQHPYQHNRRDKGQRLLADLNALVEWHRNHCQPYARILDSLSFQGPVTSMEALPMLPVQLFKTTKLSSIPDDSVVKVLTSSGTTGQQPSRIYLDQTTAHAQSRVLVSIVQSFIGTKRLPMIIVDTKSVLKDRAAMTARGAGIVGFANFGRNHFYLLNDDMQIDWEGLEAFLAKHQGEQILLFGFTYMIWQYFYQASVTSGRRIDLGDSILIHGGGWKKLTEQAVDRLTFNRLLGEQFGIRRIHNYYGMVEQVGSIFMECEFGQLHAPDYADVIVRDPVTLEVLPFGQSGLIQVLSNLPKSYPGHSLLTEDLGALLGEDDCPCSRKGRYFSVIGRLPAAELRGCSDTHAYDQGRA